jgi:hypothetical protein
MRTVDLTVTATLIAIAVAVQVAKAGVSVLFPGIELVTLTVFIAGFSFNRWIGLAVGLLTPAIYSIFLGFHPVVFSVIAAYGFLGFAAPYMRTENRALLGITGFTFALLFDIWTNAWFAILYRVELLVAFFNPLTLQIMASHIMFNSLIFALVVLPVDEAIQGRKRLK